MRATSIIMSSLGFVHDLRTGQLPPDQFRNKALDMIQYTRLFGASRIPTGNGCKIEVDDQSRHIIVLRRGQMYWFEVLDSHHRPALTERELQTNLEAIIADADKTPPHQVAQGAIGVLSTENRKTWASLRKVLLENASNRSCLEIVDSALFVVCLDDTAPDSLSEMAETMLCGTYKLDRGIQIGTCTNRFYDSASTASRSQADVKQSCRSSLRRTAWRASTLSSP